MEEVDQETQGQREQVSSGPEEFPCPQPCQGSPGTESYAQSLSEPLGPPRPPLSITSFTLQLQPHQPLIIPPTCLTCSCLRAFTHVLSAWNSLPHDVSMFPDNVTTLEGSLSDLSAKIRDPTLTLELLVSPLPPLFSQRTQQG